jgi:cell wall-associated NlpC family hydrolase
MLTREDVRGRLAAALLVLATVVAAWPTAHANERVSVAESAETKAPKKTKRKRIGATVHRLRQRRHPMGSMVGSWFVAPAAIPKERRNTIDIVLATARAQLGKPYRWAATGPSNFDCSGFTRFAWAVAGVTLPHNSAAQLAAVQTVPLGDLRPGDLVFSGSGRIGHVGIYVGQGQMIHAPHSGSRVQVAPLHSNTIAAGRPSSGAGPAPA